MVRKELKKSPPEPTTRVVHYPSLCLSRILTVRVHLTPKSSLDIIGAPPHQTPLTRHFRFSLLSYGHHRPSLPRPTFPPPNSFCIIPPTTPDTSLNYSTPMSRPQPHQFGGLYCSYLLVSSPSIPKHEFAPVSTIIDLALASSYNDLNVLSVSGSFIEIGRAVKNRDMSLSFSLLRNIFMPPCLVCCLETFLSQGLTKFTRISLNHLPSYVVC